VQKPVGRGLGRHGALRNVPQACLLCLYERFEDTEYLESSGDILGFGMGFGHHNVLIFPKSDFEIARGQSQDVPVFYPTQLIIQ
jgi:hypothetical protein